MYHLFELVPGATNCTPPGAMTHPPRVMPNARPSVAKGEDLNKQFCCVE